MDLTGKVALVTGAARRVGRAIARTLADAGCDVAIHYHTSKDEARGLVEQIQPLGRRAIAVFGDLSDPAVPARLVDRVGQTLGRMDILVNNAARFDPTPLEEAEEGVWERLFRVNTIAPAMLARAAVPWMRKVGAGRIVNLTDILADRPIRRYAAYCATKSALVSLTRSLARELAPEITVNGVAPGVAVFPEDFEPSLRKKLVSRVPLARAGMPEDVAVAVRFLVSCGDYVTGQILAVDGGRSVVP